MATVMGGNNKGADIATTTLIDHLREEGRAMRAELADNRKLIFDMLAKKNNPDEDEDKPKGLLGRLQERLESKLLDSLDKDGSTPEPGEDGKPGGKSSITAEIVKMGLQNAPAIMTGINTLATSLLNTALAMKSNATVNLSGNGTTVPPAPPVQLPTPPPPPPDPRQRFIANISSALLWHLHGGIDYDGHTFAGWLISSGPMGGELRNHEGDGEGPTRPDRTGSPRSTLRCGTNSRTRRISWLSS